MSTLNPPLTSTVARVLGAVALLVVGAVHFQQYQYDFYSAIPTIGPLLLATFVAATALGLFLLSPIRSRSRLGALVDRVVALAGAGVAAGAVIGLLISERASLFGFTEHGYRFAIVLALASEAVAIASLSIFLTKGSRANDRARAGGARPGSSSAT